MPMTFEIELNGRTHSVSIDKVGSGSTRFRVTVDGEAATIDAERVGEFGLSLVSPDGSHRSGEVQLVPVAPHGVLLAHLDGRTVPLVVNGRRTGRAATGDTAGAHGEQKIAAPMPGRVVRVLVAAGDAVTARQPVVVVEAMKMENELRSPKAGRVKSVTVSAGTSVEAGRVLVVVE
jgi:biotin carboxyl carrier protein